MYYEKRKYVKRWGFEPKEKQYRVSVKQNGKAVEGINPKRISYIIEEVGYQRKANAIHNWIINNVADGVDDCKPVSLSNEDIVKLRDTIIKVLDASVLVKGKIQNGTRYEDGKETPIMEDGKYIEDSTVAQELLPTGSGFFFGNTDYNEYYYDDLVDALKICKEMLKDDSADYYYQASW